MVYILLLINIILLVSGQTLWKTGLKGTTLTLGLDSILALVINPYIISGMTVYVIATVLWLYILSKLDLSVAYPLQSLCYVLAVFVSIFIFKEQIPLTRWIGLLLITSGAFLITIR